MTVKNKLTKQYHAKKEIEVLASSLESFLAGECATIDHLITYEFQRYLIRSKPLVKDYKFYKVIRDGYYNDLKY